MAAGKGVMRKFILILAKVLGIFLVTPRKKKKYVKGQVDDIYPHF